MWSNIYSVLQGSILALLLFLVSVYDLRKASLILMFVSNREFNKLFNDMNVELKKIPVCFNLVSSIQVKNNEGNTFPLNLSILYIDNFEVIRESVT